MGALLSANFLISAWEFVFFHIMMCGWILHTTAWRTPVAVDCLQPQSDGRAWLSTRLKQPWPVSMSLAIHSGPENQVFHQHFFSWRFSAWSPSCAASVTDQVELTVSRLLALASTGCGASCVLERHSVSWCSGEEWEDGLINHHFPPPTVRLNQESRQISASGYTQPLFSLFLPSCSSILPEMFSLISVLN